MHNKFMIVDQLFIMTGSFNWTFQACKFNQENVVVLDGEFYVEKYSAEFEKLWAKFCDNSVEQNESAPATNYKKKNNKFKRNSQNDKSDGWNYN